jgi:hypothetical protein
LLHNPIEQQATQDRKRRKTKNLKLSMPVSEDNTFAKRDHGLLSICKLYISTFTATEFLLERQIK